jgi:hypothetical protein
VTAPGRSVAFSGGISKQRRFSEKLSLCMFFIFVFVLFDCVILPYF